MTLDYDRIHNGYGYDLEALDELTPDELIRAEDLVIAQRLSGWREIDGLNHLGSSHAIAEMMKALHSAEIEVRMRATGYLVSRKLITEGDVEDIIINALGKTTILNGLAFTLRLVTEYPTPAV